MPPKRMASACRPRWTRWAARHPAAVVCAIGLATVSAQGVEGPGFTIAEDGTIIFDAPVQTEVPGPDAEPPAADAEPSTADAGPPTADAEPSTADAEPSTADAEPPTADAKPSTADAEPSTADAEPPTADAEPPTADAEPPDAPSAADTPTDPVDGDGTLVFDPPATPGDAPSDEEAAAGAAADAEAGVAETAGAAADAEAAPAVGDDGLLEEIEVIGRRPRVITPLPGVVIDEGQATGNIQQVTAEEIRESGAISATQFLSERLQSVTVQDTAGNPFQQDLVFRGFSASPVVATPQGLSVYLDGVRVNEPFGQIVNWDLIPLNIIGTLAVVPGSNPLFGLNTLAGAITINTRSGFDFPGVDISQTYGSWNRRQTQLVAGASDDHVAGLMSFNHLREDGWRQQSPSSINQAFAKAEARGQWGQLTVQGLYADNELLGGGLIPYEDYIDDPSRVYTAPDRTANRLEHFWATARGDLRDNVSVTGQAYKRRSVTRADNGDFWDQWALVTSDRLSLPCVQAGLQINGAFDTGGRGRGISGCIPNGIIGRGLASQDSWGTSLQLNWITEHNQFVAGATYDHDHTFFQQTEQLADITADRTVVADPARPYPADPNSTPIVFSRAVLRATGGDLGRALALLDAFGVSDLAPFVTDLARQGFIGVSTAFPPTRLEILRNRLRGTNESWAAFVFDVFSPTPRVNLTLGARYSRTTVSTFTQSDPETPLYQFTERLIANRLQECKPTPDALDGFNCREEEFTYHAFNPAAGFNWSPVDDLNVFGNVSRGSRTPSAIELACARDRGGDTEEGNIQGGFLPQGCTIPTALNNDPFLPQVRSTTYELGSRGRLAGRFGWNVAAFQTDLENDILFISLGVANRGVFENFGETRRRGVEMGLTKEEGRVTWFANYSYVEATFESRARLVNLSNSTSLKQQGLQTIFDVEAGDFIPGVPKHALRAAVAVDVTPRLNLSLQAIAQTGQYSRGNENNEHQPGGTDADGVTERNRRYVGEGRLAGFTVFNADARYAFTEHLTGFLQVDNLLDERYATASQLGLNSFPAGPGFGVRDASGFSNNSNDWTHSQFVGPGAPRALWLGIRYAR